MHKLTAHKIPCYRLVSMTKKSWSKKTTDKHLTVPVLGPT